MNMYKLRDPGLIEKLSAVVRRRADCLRKPIRIMEFCGGHTHVIIKYGIDQLLKSAVEFVHGPGCPVCVIPKGRIDIAIRLAEEGAVLCTYGDLLRVPGSGGKNLLHVRSRGCDIRMVYSPLDVLRIAKENSKKEVVFFAIGFETTTPQTAVLILRAKREGVKNLSVICNHVRTPSALEGIFSGGVNIDGLIAPGHVSVITGCGIYEPFAKKYGKPFVISGFEPLDILESLIIMLKRLEENDYCVDIQYKRSVKEEGNRKALNFINEVFTVREEFEWRGLGVLPMSALRIKDEYGYFDGERRFGIKDERSADNPSCLCGDIVRGKAKPTDCKLFGTVCNPKNPVGSCMVSSEGVCSAYYRYRFEENMQTIFATIQEKPI